MPEPKTLCARFSEAVEDCRHMAGQPEPQQAKTRAALLKVGQELLDRHAQARDIIASSLERLANQQASPSVAADQATARLLRSLQAATPALV